MKKTVSFLLVITLLLSIVSVISTFALQDEDSAEDSEIITEIDFESEQQKKFYTGETNVYSQGMVQRDGSNVIWLRRPYSATDNADRSPWASSMRLCDANGEALKLKAGDKISLTADV